MIWCRYWHAALLDPMDAALDLFEDILDRLDCLQLEPDVPLRQRGFSVMEEPPA